MAYRSRRTQQRRRAPLRCDTCRGRLKILRVAGGQRLPFNEDPVSMPEDGSRPDHAYPAYGLEAWNADELIAEFESRGVRLEAAVARVMDLPWYRRHGCSPRESTDDATTRDRETADR